MSPSQNQRGVVGFGKLVHDGEGRIVHDDGVLFEASSEG
jgi:hypothetical protein